MLKKNIILPRNKLFKWQWISHEKPWRLKEGGTAFFKCKKKYKPRILHTAKSILQKRKWNQDSLRWRKKEESVIGRLILKKWWKDILKTKEMTKKKYWNIRDEKTIKKVKIWVNRIDYLQNNTLWEVNSSKLSAHGSNKKGMVSLKVLTGLKGGPETQEIPVQRRTLEMLVGLFSLEPLILWHPTLQQWHRFHSICLKC